MKAVIGTDLHQGLSTPREGSLDSANSRQQGVQVVSAREGRVQPHVEALGTRFVPPDLFVEDVSEGARFNRLLLYRADLIHSASAYFGEALASRRMTAVFFWLARQPAAASGLLIRRGNCP